MTTLHHMTSKLARKHGISIAINGDDTFTMTHDFSGKSVSGTDPKALVQTLVDQTVPMKLTTKVINTGIKARDTRKKTKAGYDENGEPKVKKTLETGKSGVMFLKYHTSYMNKGGGNGDALDVALRDAVMKPGKKGEKSALDWNALEDIADRHDVWNPKYRDLNAGMARMNVANRLRALIRNDKPVTIKGAKITEL